MVTKVLQSTETRQQIELGNNIEKIIIHIESRKIRPREVGVFVVSKWVNDRDRRTAGYEGQEDWRLTANRGRGCGDNLKSPIHGKRPPEPANPRKGEIIGMAARSKTGISKQGATSPGWGITDAKKKKKRKKKKKKKK